MADYKPVSSGAGYGRCV